MHICSYNDLIVICISGFMVPILVGYLSLTDAYTYASLCYAAAVCFH